MEERGKFEVGQWVVASRASGDPETLSGKTESLAHLHGDFLGGSMMDTGACQAGDK